MNKDLGFTFHKNVVITTKKEAQTYYRKPLCLLHRCVERKPTLAEEQMSYRE